MKDVGGLQVIPGGYGSLDGIRAAGPADAWAWGAAGLLHFDGKSWTFQRIPGETANSGEGSPPDVFVEDVTAIDSNHVWLMSGKALPPEYSSMLTSIFYFDGRKWTKQYQTKNYRLNSISAHDPHHVWALGGGGTFDDPDPIILFFNGSRWARQEVPPGARSIFKNSPLPPPDKSIAEWDQSGVTSGFSQVLALDESHAMALGDQRNLIYSGGSWSAQPTGLDFGMSMGSGEAYALDQFQVWSPGPSLGGDGGDGEWHLSFYNGANWAQVPGAPYAKTVYAANPSHVWAVGAYDFKKKDRLYFFNGSTWKPQNDKIERLDGYDSSHVWGMNTFGEIYFYDGISWKQQTRGSVGYHVWADPQSYAVFNSVLPEPPSDVILEFPYVPGEGSKMTVKRDGNDVTTGPVSIDDRGWLKVSINCRTPGKYTVEYTVSGPNSKRESGWYWFYVKSK